MIEKSLQVNSEGRKTAKAALTSLGITQKELSIRKSISLSTISKFFNCKPVDRILFVQICETLKLDWQAISTAKTTETRETEQTEEIDAIVQAIRMEVRSFIQEECSTMRVLDMTQPIELTGHQGIYTDVNILEKMTRLRHLGAAELIQQAEVESVERFGLSGIVERVPGLEAVRQHRKLMILGKPGAGKTTFMKFLAMSCLEGNFLNNKVPVFISLREFAEAEGKPSLMQFIGQYRVLHDVQVLISQGRGFLLLDGLDEVREQDQKRVIRQIQSLSNHYPHNQFVITCRIAAKEYTFERFTEVEVADFSQEQIETFVRKWFNCKDPGGAEVAISKFLNKLEENKRIQELASSPLLLTLLCLEFEESFDFPESRADLYERGLKVLMSKWDASRKIERNQIYKRLSLKRKEDLLSQLALKTFAEGNYFFKQRTVEAYIAEYIANLPDAKDDADALLLDSEAVLKSIESQHGLLIERARGIYSFSHLTFQEFFAARQITNSRNEVLLKQIVSHVTEKRWREVFRLIVEMLPNAQQLLLLMKAETDQILHNDLELQKFLVWLQEKSSSVEATYKSATIRASYLSRCLGFVQFDIFVTSLDEEDKHIEMDANLGMAFLEFNDCLFFDGITYKINLSLAATIETGSTSILERGGYFEILRDLSNIDFSKCSKKLRNEFFEIFDEMDANFDFLEQWWITNNKIWTQKIRDVLVEHYNIGHDWKFSEKQKEKLQQYYDANLLLVNCLNSDCYVSRSVRQEIEETLLLPISEIEKRKKE